MNALVTIDTLTPATVFVPGGVEAIVSKLETEVRSIKTDISTDAGRKEIASIAYKVARSKTALDDMGKNLVADIKAQAGKEVYTITPAQLAEWRKAAAPLKAEWETQVKKAGGDPAAIYKDLQAELAKRKSAY